MDEGRLALEGLITVENKKTPSPLSKELITSNNEEDRQTICLCGQLLIRYDKRNLSEPWTLC